MTCYSLTRSIVEAAKNGQNDGYFGYFCKAIWPLENSIASYAVLPILVYSG